MEQSDPENRNIQPTDYPEFSLCSGMSLTITAPSDLMLESGSEVGDGLTLKLCTISEFLDNRSRGCSESSAVGVVLNLYVGNTGCVER